MVAWVLWYLRRGFDFADEGFYLTWISNPFKYTASTTQFGFLYHPLYTLVDGDIALLRQINFLATFGLSWVLSHVLLSKVAAQAFVRHRLRFAISGALATGCFVYLRLWLPTPSYNWLIYQALLIGAIGLVTAERKGRRTNLWSWVLVGVGGWLAFMAKPTSAAAFALCALAYLLAAGKAELRRLCLAAAVALVLLAGSAFVIDGSIAGFVGRLRAGLEAAIGMGSGHGFMSSFRIDRFGLAESAERFLLVSTALIVVAAVAQRARFRVLAYGALLPSIAAIVAVLAIVSGAKNIPDVGNFQQLLVWCIPLAVALLTVMFGAGESVASIASERWALVVLLSVLPYVFAFGTANNYWWHGGLAGFFWILAGVALLSPVALQRGSVALLIPVVATVQLLAAAMIHIGIERPYYQVRPLRESHQRVEIGRPGSGLLLFDELAAYANRAKSSAERAGFVRGTPVIDLTGHSPGLLYTIGASNTGQPWLIGNFPGYTGGNRVAEAALRRVSCEELSEAWLLTEPDGEVSLSPDAVATFGADPVRDYAIAGEFDTTKGVGSFMEIRTQRLLKPVRPKAEAVAACRASRKIG